MREQKANEKMEHVLILAEVVTGLVLLGLLSLNGLWRLDKLFFAYVAVFIMGTVARKPSRM